MKHTLAHQTNTIDKYLLNELPEEDRQAFEEHMFDCPECAARIKEEFAVLADLKEVLREPPPVPNAKSVKTDWREWFRPMVLGPCFATLVLGCLVGYQNMVSIPAMLTPQVIDVTPFVPATRGATSQVATVKRGAAVFAASFAVVSPNVFPGYVCEFQADGKGPLTTMDCGKHPTTEFTLSLVLPSAKFPRGGYTMILRSASDQNVEVGRYSFAIKNESQ